ncbi:hypothetical protein D3C81_2218960 [compost metagenome]
MVRLCSPSLRMALMISVSSSANGMSSQRCRRIMRCRRSKRLGEVLVRCQVLRPPTRSSLRPIELSNRSLRIDVAVAGVTLS